MSLDPNQRRLHTAAAVSAVHNRRTRLPSMDFTVHTSDEGQVFNTTERVVKDVQAPAFLKPTDEQFYADETRQKPNIAFLKNHFFREGRLTDEQVRSRPRALSTSLARACSSLTRGPLCRAGHLHHS